MWSRGRAAASCRGVLFVEGACGFCASVAPRCRGGVMCRGFEKRRAATDEGRVSFSARRERVDEHASAGAAPPRPEQRRETLRDGLADLDASRVSSHGRRFDTSAGAAPPRAQQRGQAPGDGLAELVAGRAARDGPQTRRGHDSAGSGEKWAAGLARGGPAEVYNRGPGLVITKARRGDINQTAQAPSPGHHHKFRATQFHAPPRRGDAGRRFAEDAAQTARARARFLKDRGRGARFTEADAAPRRGQTRPRPRAPCLPGLAPPRDAGEPLYTSSPKRPAGRGHDQRAGRLLPPQPQRAARRRAAARAGLLRRGPRADARAAAAAGAGEAFQERRGPQGGDVRRSVRPRVDTGQARRGVNPLPRRAPADGHGPAAARAHRFCKTSGRGAAALRDRFA
mmetsp:Transcript_16784/g.44828  ORF Transcript_16784/g.44828 Transcript_16784/m.44828 type:complete len:397 (+) Transcript_16784:708-1898(+)